MKGSTHSFKLRSHNAAIVFIVIHILPWINAMLDFICIDIIELRRTQNNRKIQNEKFLFTVGFEPTTFIFIVRLFPTTGLVFYSILVQQPIS